MSLDKPLSRTARSDLQLFRKGVTLLGVANSFGDAALHLAATLRSATKLATGGATPQAILVDTRIYQTAT
jgi:Ca2+/Na+ antiporter